MSVLLFIKLPDPDTIYFPQGLKETEVTELVCPSNFWTVLHDSRSHTRIEWSSKLHDKNIEY
jgi:hypothetical protein